MESVTNDRSISAAPGKGYVACGPLAFSNYAFISVMKVAVCGSRGERESFSVKLDCLGSAGFVFNSSWDVQCVLIKRT